MTTLMCNQLSPGLPKQLESVRVNIGMPVVRTDGRSVGHVITKFSGVMADFKILAFQNPEFKILADFKILAFHDPEFKIFAYFKISAFHNPEFKIVADFKILAFQMLKSRF